MSQPRATSRAVSEYYEQSRSGPPPEAVRTEASRDLAELSHRQELDASEAAAVQAIQQRVETGGTLLAQDVDRITGIVDHLETQIQGGTAPTAATGPGSQMEAIRDPHASIRDLQGYQARGDTMEVRRAASGALADRARASTDAMELHDIRHGSLVQGVSDETVDTAVLHNPHASIREVEDMAHDHFDSHFRMEAAEVLRQRAGTGTSADDLHYLAQHNRDYGVQTALTQNPATSAEDLQHLAEHGTSDSIRAAASHALAGRTAVH